MSGNILEYKNVAKIQQLFTVKNQPKNIIKILHGCYM